MGLHGVPATSPLKQDKVDSKTWGALHQSSCEPHETDTPINDVLRFDPGVKVVDKKMEPSQPLGHDELAPGSVNQPGGTTSHIRCPISQVRLCLLTVPLLLAGLGVAMQVKACRGNVISLSLGWRL